MKKPDQKKNNSACGRRKKISFFKIGNGNNCPAKNVGKIKATQ